MLRKLLCSFLCSTTALGVVSFLRLHTRSINSLVREQGARGGGALRAIAVGAPGPGLSDNWFANPSAPFTFNVGAAVLLRAELLTKRRCGGPRAYAFCGSEKMLFGCALPPPQPCDGSHGHPPFGPEEASQRMASVTVHTPFLHVSDRHCSSRVHSSPGNTLLAKQIPAAQIPVEQSLLSPHLSPLPDKQSSKPFALPRLSAPTFRGASWQTGKVGRVRRIKVSGES